MFSRRPTSSEINELWAELHDLENRVTGGVEHRIRSLEDERTRRAATQEVIEENANARRTRRRKIFIAISGILGIGSAIVNILTYLRLI